MNRRVHTQSWRTGEYRSRKVKPRPDSVITVYHSDAMTLLSSVDVFIVVLMLLFCFHRFMNYRYDTQV